MTETGGRVEVDYVVNMEHVVASRNRFQITVTEKKDHEQPAGC